VQAGLTDSDGVCLELRDVGLSRNGSPILSGVSLKVRAGENLTILGPSGSGKTSLLRLMNRLEDADEGAIRLGGRDIRTLDPIGLRRSVGIVFQTPVMLDGTVADNIGYGPTLAGIRCEPSALMETVGLEPALLERPAERLSVGQKQRVELARALANGPELLLLDEPTSGLDVGSAGRILDLITELQRSLSLTVVFVTHLLDQAERLADRVGLLVRGELDRLQPRDQFFSQDRAELHGLFDRQ
jgi:putative ABC transport system ATP-binding protein